jgi:NADH-quinone oxidoreductase subunit N
MGYLLLGVLSGTANGYSSAMFYIITYALMSVGGFGMVILLSRQGFEAENIDDFRGLNQRSPWYAFVMLLLMFSMAGVPPTVGFYAKLAVLQSVLQISLTWLAIVAVLFSLIGAFYYLRMVKVMYFDAPVDTAPLGNGFDMRMLLSANGLAVLVLGLLPQPLMALCVSSIEHSLRQL